MLMMRSKNQHLCLSARVPGHLHKGDQLRQLQSMRVHAGGKTLSAVLGHRGNGC